MNTPKPPVPPTLPKLGQPGATCADCRFWQAVTPGSSSTREDELTAEYGSLGECRRNPPSIGKGGHPQARAKHWCGKFKA